jgi:hypothetical protein
MKNSIEKRIEELEKQQVLLKKEMFELQLLVVRMIHKSRKEKQIVASK